MAGAEQRFALLLSVNTPFLRSTFSHLEIPLFIILHVYIILFET